MANEITTVNSQAIAVWQDSENIRKIFAPKLTETEFKFFMGLGKALGANPFTREIWAVKYQENQPASTFCGRDFYRRKAQEQPDYNGHVVEVIYANDELLIQNGMITRHVPNFKEPGKIWGAYCIVFREDKTPYVARVRFDEYNKGFSNWKSMPETMIKKVAEAQGLRGAYQGIFAGTYAEGEEWDQEKPSIKPTVVTITPESIVDPGEANAVADEPKKKLWPADEMRKIIDDEAHLMARIKGYKLAQMRELFDKHNGDGEKIKQDLAMSLTPDEAQKFVATLKSYEKDMEKAKTDVAIRGE